MDTPESVKPVDLTTEQSQKAVALTRLHDEIFGKISAILKCAPKDVNNKLQKWMKQTAEIQEALALYEIERQKIEGA